MRSIYLVRHGEYENPRNIIPGRLPVTLSEEGISQVKRLREYFNEKEITKIYSSSVLRCKQTSERVSGGKIPIVFDKRLLEVLSAYQGYWINETSNFYAYKNTLGGETIEDVQKRVVDFFTHVIQNENGNSIICSHGDPLYSLYCFLMKKPLPKDGDKENDIPEYPKKGSVIEIKLDTKGHVLP